MPLRTLRPAALLLFALIPAALTPRAFAVEPDRAEIGVLLRFDAAPGSAFVTAMERELTQIMAEADLRLKWLTPGESDGKQNFARAVVFTFHGSCRAIPTEREEEPLPSRVSLADTAVEGTAILPFSEMNCDRLRQFLSGEEPRGAGAESRLGLAMARVLAHEMYHVLLQTRTHGRHGISRAAHTPSALLSRSLRFDQEEIARFRERFEVKTTIAAQNISFRPN